MLGVVLGNVKPSFIKRIAKGLLKEYYDEFSEDFEKNKVLVANLTTIYSKIMRNRIAGYISRMMEKNKKLENEAKN